MFLFRIIWMGVRALQANLMRSLLATLGVIIGVSAVVSAMSILAGTKQDIVERVESMGADQLFVVNGSGRRHSRHTIVPRLTREDARAIREECELVRAVMPEVQGGAQVKYYEHNVVAQISGTGEAFAAVNDYLPREGRFFNKEDVRSGRRICALGHKVAGDLFGDLPAAGHHVKINGASFLVCGVMEKKGVLGFREVDTQVFVPVTTAMNRMFGLRYLQNIVVQVTDVSRTSLAIKQVQAVLRKQHRIRAGNEDDFAIFTQEQVSQRVGDFTRIFAVVLGSIAGISLAVGGIGIMNIMLVSVTERTREIGVRIAVGARRGDILKQFLVEAGMISLCGGAIGVPLGMLFSDTIERVTGVIKVFTPPESIYWALTMAMGIGVLSGLYPAIRASRLDPVEALRYE